MKDVILYTVEKENIEVKRGDYSIATIHREENVESKERLTSIISGLIESKEKIIFPVHPRTRKRLKEFGLIDIILRSSTVEIIEPQSYLKFVKLLAGANKVITDSGGVRREGYMLGKPVIILINIIWFPEILDAGWKFVADANRDKIADAINNFEPDKKRPNIFGNGNAHEIIVDSLINRFGEKK